MQHVFYLLIYFRMKYMYSTFQTTNIFALIEVNKIIEKYHVI